MTKINPVLSDLFFNHEHFEYDLYMRNQVERKTGYLSVNFSEADQEKALMIDAEAFIINYGSVLINCPTAKELTEDFFNRV